MNDSFPSGEEPRGIRNNNPGNIVKGDNWFGLDPIKTEEEPRFCVFRSPEFGLRALSIVLMNYQKHHHLRTIKDMLTRYAPRFENNTDSYISHVADKAGLYEDEEFEIKADINRFIEIIKAIVHHENGKCPYSDSVIYGVLHTAIATH